MPTLPNVFIQFAAALAIGLLIGLNRERRKGQGEQRSPFGLRTFTLVSLTGNLIMQIGDPMLIGVTGLAVCGAAVLAHVRYSRPDPGFTTELAFVVTFLIGALAQRNPSMAITAGVVVTALLTFKPQLHQFAHTILTESELQDGVLYIVAALVILPVLPNRAVDLYGVLNPFAIWRLVVVMLGIGGLGYVALRAFGPRLGLAISGFASGFVSSTATISAMGMRAIKSPNITRLAATGAVMSNIATVVEMVIVLAMTSVPVLTRLSVPLGLAFIVVLSYGALAMRNTPVQTNLEALTLGSPLEFRRAFIFAAMIAAVTLTAALLNGWLGSSAVVIVTAIAGFADTHSPAISAASLAASGGIGPDQARTSILLAMTTNIITKAVVALSSGSREFARALLPCLALMIIALWVGYLVG